MTSLSGFFYAGTMPLVDEVSDDLTVGLVQPRKSLFYNRGYGCGISGYESFPTSLTSQVSIKYEAARLFAVRNNVVTSGQDGFPDRRAVTSQPLINVVKEESSYSLSVQYILMADMTRSRSITVPMGGA
jgi:hypothetical protein